jgi:hypothetical protein
MVSSNTSKAKMCLGPELKSKRVQGVSARGGPMKGEKNACNNKTVV